MRHVKYQVLGLRVPELDRIVLNDRERRTLRAAAAILDAIRTAREARVPVDWYAGEEDDADMLFGWRICRDLAEAGTIAAETHDGTPSPLSG